LVILLLSYQIQLAAASSILDMGRGDI